MGRESIFDTNISNFESAEGYWCKRIFREGLELFEVDPDHPHIIVQKQCVVAFYPRPENIKCEFWIVDLVTGRGVFGNRAFAVIVEPEGRRVVKIECAIFEFVQGRNRHLRGVELWRDIGIREGENRYAVLYNKLVLCSSFTASI